MLVKTHTLCISESCCLCSSFGGGGRRGGVSGCAAYDWRISCGPVGGGVQLASMAGQVRG